MQFNKIAGGSGRSTVDQGGARMRLTNRISGWLVMAGIALLVSNFSAFAADPVITVKKAADVNGVSITMLTLNNEYRQVLKQQGITEEDIPADQVTAFKKELLDSLINQELLFQECQKNNIAVGEENVNTSLSEVKENFESEEEYQNALNDANMKESELSARIRKTLAINELVEEKVSRNVVVTDEESMAYYTENPDSFQRTEKVRASHILVKVDRDAGEAKKVASREKIENIRRRIMAGEDFAQLAKENSDCPSSSDGGELGYFERGKMVQEFEDAAFALEPGDVGDIVQTQYGFHVIKVTDKIKGGTIEYETVKSNLDEFLRRKKIQTEVSAYIETLRNDAVIEIYL